MDIDAIDTATRGFLDAGMNVMNAFLLAETEAAHAARLLDLIAPEPGAVLLDAGCGTGAMAALLLAQRPDLRIKLLNLSAMQLALCPEGMERIEASFDQIPLADGSVDVVVFNHAMCHSDDWMVTLVEARRVLREGGVLFIFDMARLDGGDNALMQRVLQACAYPLQRVCDAAQRAGFEVDVALLHTPVVERLRQVMPGTYDLVVGQVAPASWRLVRRTVVDPVASALSRHQRVAFQFSGGRDSTAALYLLRPYWDRLTVYHLDTGDQFPETRAVVEQVERDFGRPFERIAGDVAAVRRDVGLASDLVPVDNTPTGQLVSGRPLKIISRYECCWRSLMAPMHARIVQDGITLLVRGQRDDEYATPPLRSGQSQDGIEVLYPIEGWSGEQVSAYLQDNHLPLAVFYERGARRAPECMGCTAWWDEGRAEYLREYHPVKFEAYRAQMRVIRIEIDRQYAFLKD